LAGARDGLVRGLIRFGKSPLIKKKRYEVEAKTRKRNSTSRENIQVSGKNILIFKETTGEFKL
jgi:hypothetical protein